VALRIESNQYEILKKIGKYDHSKYSGDFWQQDQS